MEVKETGGRKGHNWTCLKAVQLAYLLCEERRRKRGGEGVRWGEGRRKGRRAEKEGKREEGGGEKGGEEGRGGRKMEERKRSNR